MPVTTGGYAGGTAVTGSIDNAVNKYVAEAHFTLQERPGVIWDAIRGETLPRNQGPSVHIPKYGTVTTQALTQGVDMAQAQEITDTVMQITPAEFGAQVALSDMLLMTVRDEFFRVAGRILGDSFDRQREQTLADDLDNFSNALGSAGTSLAIGHVMAANSRVVYGNPAAGAGRGGEPGPGRIYGFFTPTQIHSLKKTMSIQVFYSGGEQHLNEPGNAAYSREFDAGGVMVRQSININKDASDDAKGGVLSEEAMIGVQLGGGPSAEKERDASMRGWEVNFVGRWARAEYNDAWGVEMLFDSAAASS